MTKSGGHDKSRYPETSLGIGSERKSPSELEIACSRAPLAISSNAKRSIPLRQCRDLEMTSDARLPLRPSAFLPRRQCRKPFQRQCRESPAPLQMVKECGPNCIYYIFHIQENSFVRCDTSITNCFPNRRYRTPSGLKIYIHTQKPAYIKSLGKKCLYSNTCRLSTLYLWRHMSDDGRIAPRHSQQSI